MATWTNPTPWIIAIINIIYIPIYCKFMGMEITFNIKIPNKLSITKLCILSTLNACANNYHTFFAVTG